MQINLRRIYNKSKGLLIFHKVTECVVKCYFEAEQRIMFFELFHKSDKENENRKWILNNFT